MDGYDEGRKLSIHDEGGVDNCASILKLIPLHVTKECVVFIASDLSYMWMCFARCEFLIECG